MTLGARAAASAIAALLMLVVLPCLSTARAETRFHPAYLDHPMLGPQAAKGVVIWNHGTTTYYAASDPSESAVPIFVSLLRDAGFDVYRLDRPPSGESIDASTAALLAAVQQVKSEGYRKIVLAGQSAGAWISIIAAGKTADIYAVIANAPAYYGVDHPRYTMNAYVLFDNLKAVQTRRVMLSFFRNDPFDPGGRGPKSAEILRGRGIDTLITDQPEGFSGHDSGNGGLFYRRFGPCVLAMAGNGPVPTRETCESDWGRKPSAEVALPPGTTPLATGSGAIAPFLGRWWGTYQNGREVSLVITHVDGERVDALYLVGSTPSGDAKSDAIRRTGRITGDTLELAEAGKPTIRFRVRADQGLDVEWLSANGTSRLTTVLQRVTP